MSEGTECSSTESVELPRGLSASFEAESLSLLKLSLKEVAIPKQSDGEYSGRDFSQAGRKGDCATVARNDEKLMKCPSTPYPWKVSTPVWGGAMFNADFQLKLPLSDIESSTDDASSVFGVRPRSRYVISEEWIHETTEDFGSNCSVISGSLHLPELHRSKSVPTVPHSPLESLRRRVRSI
uniref:Uncharacterized protein n=1 Tax=Trichuris muris TaxID=70415 RepID=A0A5S6R134_TRIMR